MKSDKTGSISKLMGLGYNRLRRLLDRGTQSAAGTPAGPAPGMLETFQQIYRNNHWGSEISHSGTGSDLVQTERIREILPILHSELGIKTMLDVPCGDFFWMGHTKLKVDYIGADVVPELIARNTEKYASSHRRFLELDVSQSDLPKVDIIFCRDLLVHFSSTDIVKAIKNMKRSGSTWFLTTTFTNRNSNIEIPTGKWRPINLQLEPFNFPEPVRLINEGCTEFGTDWADKSLGLWRLSDLRAT